MPVLLPGIGQREAYDTTDIGQLARVLRRRARTIIFFTALAGAAALLHVLFATPQFTAHGALYLGATQQGPSSGNDDTGTVNLSAYSTQSDVETQIELLTTGTLIERAVLETGLNSTLRPVGVPALTYWRWRFFHGGLTSFFLPNQQSLQVVNATLAGHYELRTGPRNGYELYTTGALFHAAQLVLTGIIGETAYSSTGSLLVRFAPPLEDDAASGSPPDTLSMNTVVTPGLTYILDVVPPDALASKLTSGAFNVNAGGDPTQPTKLATLQFRWSDPYEAKLFVNQMMEDYIATQLQWKTEAASVTESFVASQLAKVSQQVADANQALSDYQAQTGIVDPQQTAQAVVAQMEDLQRQRDSLLLKMQALQRLDEMFRISGTTVDEDLISQAGDNVLSALSTSLAMAHVKLSQLQAEYTDTAPDVTIQRAQVAELHSSIQVLIANDMKATTQNLADVDRLIGLYREQLKDQPAELLKVETLKQNSDQLGQLYQLLTQKAEQAQISKAATIIDTRIVTPSELPLSATSPRLLITVIAGSFAGFIVGIVLVFIQHGFSGRYESEEQIREGVALPVYGMVPRRQLAMITGPSDNRLPVPLGLTAFSEAFQLIKRNIYLHTDPAHATAILIISANPQDGKTTIAANLAKTLADDGKRVLLLNCDIYASHKENALDFSGCPGLMDWVLTGERPSLQHCPDSDFWVLPAGRLQAGFKGRLDEPRLAKIFAALTPDFDYLILDSPPLPIVSDGLLLGRFADLILSIINVSHTMRRAFDLHNELIGKLGKPHGLVINGADVDGYGDIATYLLGDISNKQKFTGWYRTGG